jgi:hypothetical protein
VSTATGTVTYQTVVAIITTVKVGSEDAELRSNSGSYFFVSFEVGSGAVGSSLRLFRSSDGMTWEANAPDASCVLDGAQMCSFRTDHLTYFAPATVTTTSVTAPVATASPAISGGNGGGSGGSGGGAGLVSFAPTTSSGSDMTATGTDTSASGALSEGTTLSKNRDTKPTVSLQSPVQTDELPATADAGSGMTEEVAETTAPLPFSDLAGSFAIDYVAVLKER